MDYLAITVTEATLKFLNDGGIFIYPLLLCSIAGLTAIGFKFLALARDRVIPNQLAHILENASDYKKVTEAISNHDSALSRLAAVALKNKSHDAKQMSQSVEAMAREEVLKMHSGIGVLDIVITIAPLLGLLGSLQERCDYLVAHQSEFLHVPAGESEPTRQMP